MGTPGWQPPSSDPPRYVVPTQTEDNSVWPVLAGVAAMVLGVIAVVFENLYKLDAETLLTGGKYLKDGYRWLLFLGGVTLVPLGLALTIVSSVRAPNQQARRVLLIITLVNGVVTTAALLYAIIVLSGSGA